MIVMQHKLDDLKKMIHGKTDIPPSKQHLYYGRKLLYVQEVLKILNDQANLQLITKLPGGIMSMRYVLTKDFFSVPIANNICVMSAANKYINIQREGATLLRRSVK